MTPAVDTLKSLGIDHELLRFKTKMAPDLALAVADELGLDPAQVFKTLVTESDTGDLFVALVPATRELNLKALASATGSRKMQMADQGAAERSSGYLKGAISPVGQKHVLPTYLDESAARFDRIYVSAGKRGLELQLDTADLVQVCRATLSQLTR